MDPLKLKLTGLVLFLFGAAATGFSYMDMAGNLDLLPRMLGFGALIASAIFFVMGLTGTAAKATGSVRALHHEDGAMAALAVIRCMIAVSVADGNLDGRESAMIARIYKQLTGSSVDEDAIRETADEMIAQGVDLESELDNVKAFLPTELKEKILKAAFYILAADGQAEQNEEATLETVRAGLGISKGRYKAVQESFMNRKKT